MPCTLYAWMSDGGLRRNIQEQLVKRYFREGGNDWLPEFQDWFEINGPDAQERRRRHSEAARKGWETRRRKQVEAEMLAAAERIKAAEEQMLLAREQAERWIDELIANAMAPRLELLMANASGAKTWDEMWEEAEPTDALSLAARARSREYAETHDVRDPVTEPTSLRDLVAEVARREGGAW